MYGCAKETSFEPKTTISTMNVKSHATTCLSLSSQNLQPYINPATSNRNCLVSQKLYHQGHTLHDLRKPWQTKFSLS